ncbi:Cell division control [Pelomyxa schiedti]|nr:Cell division control [Pelomyxa schiedti]
MFEEKAYNVRLWDTAGGEDYDRTRRCCYPGTDIFLLCFSLVNLCSFENIRSKWFPEISHHCPKTPFIIVGTKRDLRTDPACLNRLLQKHMSPVTFEMGSELAQELHAAAYVETSSLTGEHVQDLFTLAVKVATTGRRKKPVPVNLMFEEKAYNVRLWDTAGGEDYDRTRRCCYPGTDIFLLCFSLVNLRSFENIRSKWFPEISHHCPKTPFIIVGTKRDLRTDPACLNRLLQKHMSPVTFEMGSELAQELHAAAYVETSSLTGEHVQDLFTLAVKVATTGRRKKPVPSSFSLGTLWNSLVPRIGSSTRPASSSTVHHHHQPSWSKLFSDVDVAARYGHSQSRCGTVMITVGGMCADGAPPPPPDVLRFDCSSGNWLHPFPLAIADCAENQSHSVGFKGMTFVASVYFDNLMFLFGGRNNSCNNSLHCLNMNTGECFVLPEGNHAESPSPRYGSSMIAFAKCLFVFGGYDCDSVECEDLRCYDLTVQSWIQMLEIKPGIPAPSGRFHHTAVCHNGNMIIFGGMSNGKKLNDMWTFDISSKAWLKPSTRGTAPPGMRGHAAAVIGDEMFVCTCDPPSSPSSMAMFKLTLGSSTFEWSRVEIGNTPPVREFHTLISSGTGSLILAGGRELTAQTGTPSGKLHGDGWHLQLFSNVFQILPHELWMFILSFCDPKDLFRLSAVCRDFRALSSSDILWAQFIPESIISSRTNKGATLKSLFRSTSAFYIYKSGTYLTDAWIFFPRE